MVLHNNIWGDYAKNSATELKAIAQKISGVEATVTELPGSRKAVVSYEVAQLITYGGKDET